ncbi:MAG: DUF167 domain-containing protein [Candidatus Gribaldobacteria bacterium]|nr:DUF167 domain-containing protein [Candidatus Gribaldobacteria bacterium]
MKIFVRVKVGAKEEVVEKIDVNHFRVFVKALAQEGKANRAVVKILAKYFKVTQSQIEIKSGLASNQKIIEISL